MIIEIYFESQYTMPEKLILEPLKKAVASLTEVVAQPKDEFMRDATIQRFEYTFELSWKMIKRHLDWTGHGDTASLPRKELLREAAKIGIIDDPEKWFVYNRARNASSHTYNVNTAEEVYEQAVLFVLDAIKLIEVLSSYHD